MAEEVSLGHLLNYRRGLKPFLYAAVPGQYYDIRKISIQSCYTHLPMQVAATVIHAVVNPPSGSAQELVAVKSRLAKHDLTISRLDIASNLLRQCEDRLSGFPAQERLVGSIVHWPILV